MRALGKVSSWITYWIKLAGSWKGKENCINSVSIRQSSIIHTPFDVFICVYVDVYCYCCRRRYVWSGKRVLFWVFNGKWRYLQFTWVKRVLLNIVTMSKHKHIWSILWQTRTVVRPTARTYHSASFCSLILWRSLTNVRYLPHPQNKRKYYISHYTVKVMEEVTKMTV